MRATVKRHPVTAFCVLAYALSWWPAVLYALDLSPLPIAGFGPFLAAVGVLSLTSGKGGVAAMLRGMVRWRVGARWWAVALLLPVALAGTAVALNLLLGAPAPSADELNNWPSILPVFLIVLLVPGFGGSWEEPGWRGYALPRLAAERSPLAASLIVGLLWAGWHLPLFLVGEIEWPDLGLIVAASVVFAWVFEHAQRSVLLAMAFHAMNNAVSGEFFSPMFSNDDAARQSWLLALVWAVAAVVVVIVAGPAFRSRASRTMPEAVTGAPALRSARPI